MNKDISRKQALTRILRIFVAQYIAKIHNMKSFESEVISMLTVYIIEFIKKISIRINKLTHMQGRTQSNCLHLLLSIEQMQLFDIQKLLQFIIVRRQENIQFDQIFLQSIHKQYRYQQIELENKYFQDDIQCINHYQREKQYSNIKYILTPYNLQFKKQEILPINVPIDQCFTKPIQMTYRSTSQKIKRQNKNVQNLTVYTKKEIKKSLGILIDDTTTYESIIGKRNKKQDQKYNHQNNNNCNSNQSLQKNSKINQFSMIDFL